MASISQVHSKFLSDLFEASKLLPDNFPSILPSVLFLVSIFILLYVQFHRYTNALTRWKTKICRDLIFQWTFFYTSRIWFIFIRLCKFGVQYSDRAIQNHYLGPEEYYNKFICHSSLFLFVFTVSLVPCLILYIRFFNRREMPNFLMWVAEDPWVRSEMGTSGHYLEHPPNSDIYSPQKYNASYRSGRSSSVDTNVYLQKPSSFLRTCRSAVSVKKSTEDIVG